MLDVNNTPEALAQALAAALGPIPSDPDEATEAQMLASGLLNLLTAGPRGTPGYFRAFETVHDALAGRLDELFDATCDQWIENCIADDLASGDDQRIADARAEMNGGDIYDRKGWL